MSGPLNPEAKSHVTPPHDNIPQLKESNKTKHWQFSFIKAVFLKLVELPKLRIKGGFSGNTEIILLISSFKHCGCLLELPYKTVVVAPSLEPLY